MVVSEAGNRRRIDNKMSKRKNTKGRTMNYKTLHRKLKSGQHEPHETERMRYEVSNVSFYGKIDYV